MITFWTTMLCMVVRLISVSEEFKSLQCSKGFIPFNWDGDEEQLWNMLCLFNTLCGVEHPLAIELHKSLRLYKRNQSSFKIGILVYFGADWELLQLNTFTTPLFKNGTSTNGIPPLSMLFHHPSSVRTPMNGSNGICW